MNEQELPTPDENLEAASRTPTGDLKHAQASLFKAATKLLGVLTLSCVPATAAWVDAHTQAVEAQTAAHRVAGAAAKEKVTSDIAYDELATRIERLEANCLAVKARLKAVKARADARAAAFAAPVASGAPVPAGRGLFSETLAGRLDEASAAELPSPPGPARVRPQAKPEAVEAMRQRVLQGNLD